MRSLPDGARADHSAVDHVKGIRHIRLACLCRGMLPPDLVKDQLRAAIQQKMAGQPAPELFGN